MHREDHAARSQEQQRFEKRVRREMENAGADRDPPRANRDEHVAELGDRGVREHALDVPLLQGDRRGEQRGQRPDARDNGAGHGRHREQQVAARHEIDAGGHHRCGVDQCGHRRRSGHGIGKPGEERDLRGLAGTPEEQEQRDGGNRPASGDKCARRVGEHGAEVERAGRPEDHEHRDHEAEVADPVHDERLAAGIRVELEGIPESNQQIAAESNAFPPHEHDREARAEHEQQHEEHEQIEIGEIARVPRIFLHVTNAEDVNQGPDTGDDEQHHGRQLVHLKAGIHLQATDVNPGPVLEHDGRVSMQCDERAEHRDADCEAADEDTDADDRDRRFHGRSSERQRAVQHEAEQG